MITKSSTKISILKLQSKTISLYTIGIGTSHFTSKPKSSSSYILELFDKQTQANPL